METLVGKILLHIGIFRYLILYPIAVVEGPILMVVSGFLVRTGALHFLPAYLILVAGDLTGDIVWYFVGRHGIRSFLRRFRFIHINLDKMEDFERAFQKHQVKILFISKLTTGFGFAVAVLVAAGAARVRFRTYMTINGFGEFIWAGMLMGVGYLFGHAYETVNAAFHGLFLIGIVVVVGAAIWFFGKRMRKIFINKTFS